MDNFTFPKEEKKQEPAAEKKNNSKGFLKYLFVGIIVLILVILCAIVKSKVYDRNCVYEDAEYKITSAAGDRFYTKGAYIAIPWKSEKSVLFNDRNTCKGVLEIPASFIKYKGNLLTENRTLGIYSAPVFTGILEIEAYFEDYSQQLLNYDKAMEFDLTNASIYFSMEDSSLIDRPVICVSGTEYKTNYSSEKKVIECNVDLTESGLKEMEKSKIEVSGKFNIRGAEEFRIYLNSTESELELTSDWTSPGFTSFDYLPSYKEINSENFTAKWSVPFDRGNGAHSIGFSYVQPVDLYAKLLRSVNYGFLFIIVPFIVLFMFEVFAKINLHPMNYLLCGAASVLFFLLLLSISEHLSFGLSYMIGAFAAGLLVSLYVCWITNKKKFGIIMSFVFLFLYTYLYVCLMSEDYALLMGSIFAFVLLAVIMFITRKIDWANLKKNSDTDLI